jgi:hypothetical protein
MDLTVVDMCVLRGRYGNGRGAAHHPTRAGHLFRGEIIAYTILLPFMDALYEVKSDLESGVTDKKELLQSESREL